MFTLRVNGFCLSFLLRRRRYSPHVLWEQQSVREGSALPLSLCLQPHDMWRLCIPSCHWRGWLTFRECSGGWCLLLPLHVGTWHVPSGKHIHKRLPGLRCLPSCWLSQWTDVFICWMTESGFLMQENNSVIIWVPDMTHVRNINGRFFTPSGQSFYRPGFINPVMWLSDVITSLWVAVLLYCCETTSFGLSFRISRCVSVCGYQRNFMFGIYISGPIDSE